MQEYTPEQLVHSRTPLNLISTFESKPHSNLRAQTFNPAAAAIAASVIACGLLSWLYPIALAMTSVFLFAGPHNFVELRYFLSRLPSRPKQWLPFFVTSIAGISILATSFFLLTYSAKVAPWQGTANTIFQWLVYASWQSALILWIGGLIRLANKASNLESRSIPAIKEILLFAWFAPSLFGLCLVYAHPLIGLWLLDKELSNRYKEFRKTYHWCLALAAGVFVLIWCLPTIQELLPSSVLQQKIMAHAGSATLPWLSPSKLLSSHVFLELLHYMAWLVGIPLVALRAKRHAGLVSMPITHLSKAWKTGAITLFMFAFTCMLVLWFSFAIDYESTRDLYFTLAITHVLAEFPFLIKSTVQAKMKQVN